ncbi:MAG: acetylxylan esterase, partial [Planctomycetaceae bacterium]|nr:acetylxylan esterase [Planctomycetaceae bacterium]
ADRLLTENPQLARWFENQVKEIEETKSLFNYETLDEWTAAKPKLRQQLFEMLGLSPLPERTELNAVTTGVSDSDEFRVERVHFQSMPGLYVTGNLYLPRHADGPLPAILYVCGHGNNKVKDVSYGSKTAYQRHGSWFARNGYVCLIIDTLQLGEIEGIHHGTYRYNRWWWNSRGYTPAGVEAWNCIRSLDYLQSRSEVDGSRIGVTGRSGGGAYSWWISALDERIQCSVPVAGTTTLRDHVVNGCVEGHCDCMYMVNTHRWDYATVAALVAPRPLLLSNTDKDSIFPLEGVIEIHRQVRHIYDLYQKPDHFGLQITEGPHKDTQELHIHAFRWMNRFLRHNDDMIDTLAVNFFEPPQLKVFSSLPSNQKNTRIDEIFVPTAQSPGGEISDRSVNQFQPETANKRIHEIALQCLQSWPDSHEHKYAVDKSGLPLKAVPPGKVTVTRYETESQPLVPIAIDVLQNPTTKLGTCQSITVIPGDTKLWNDWQSYFQADAKTAGNTGNSIDALIQQVTPDHAVAFVWTRGYGPNQWKGDDRKQIQIKRRFQLIGTTVDTMRIWDVCSAIRMLRMNNEAIAIKLQSTSSNSNVCLLACLFEPVKMLSLVKRDNDSTSDTAILNLDRTITTEELVALALTQCGIHVDAMEPEFEFAAKVSESSHWPGHKLTAR